jgi:guanine deaminase
MAASTPITPTVYLGAFVHSISLTTLEICPNGAIGVDSTGTIVFVEKDIIDVDALRSQNPSFSSAPIIKIPGNGFFFPGFIDTHTHAPQHPNTGLFGKTTLLDWLQTYTFPMESSFSDLARAQRIYSSFVGRTLSHGTTTCAYYATIHVPATNLLADICLAKGQRALVGRVCMDSDLSPDYYRDESVDTSVRDSKASIEYIRSIDPSGSIVQPIVTPRFAPSCTPVCLTAISALAREHDTFVQTHISENVGEIALVKHLFPDSESYTHVYDTHGLLTPKTILAHAVHLDAAERGTILARGAKISHCPASNTAITSGCCPVRTLLSEGHVVGLGTDVSGGFHPSEAAKLSTEEALYLATRGGARVVGLEDKVGGFEVGMEWDAQMVSLGEVGEEVVGPVDVFGWESWAERVEKWVYSGDDRNTVAVWVRGRLVHRTGRYAEVDEV